MIAVRIFRSVWFLSVVAVLTILLYQYASWPEELVIGQGEVNFITLTRDGFFYTVIAILTLVNVTVYAIRTMAKRADGFVAWFYGCIAVINFFFIVALSFVSLFNSNENYRFGEIGFIIYGSLFLIGLWIIGGLLYWLVQKSR
jgi:hypothetical protein